MKLITLHEPWATLMAIGAKKIETRGWDTDFRGLVAIHAAKGGLSTMDLEATCRQTHFFTELKKFEPFLDTAHYLRGQLRKVFPFGRIVAVGHLVDCLPTESVGCLPGVFDDYPELETKQEIAFGNYESRRFGFVFENVRRLKDPVAYSSRQGKLLDVDFNTEALILEQMQ